MTHTIFDFLEEGSFLAGLSGFLLIVVLSFAPIIPMPIVFGVIGYTYELWFALLLNWGAATLGAQLMFSIVRHVFPHQAKDRLHRQPKLHYFFSLVENHAFRAVLLARLIPIFPSVGVNSVSAIAHVPAVTFLTATAIGKLPLVIVYTVAGNQIDIYTWQSVLILVIYTVVILGAASYIERKWKLRKTSKTEIRNTKE